jgi:hypothetical protein
VRHDGPGEAWSGFERADRAARGARRIRAFGKCAARPRYVQLTSPSRPPPGEPPLSLRRHLPPGGRWGLSVTMWFASNGGRVALRYRLSEHNWLAEADGMCITMVQAKPGQDSKGRIALRRVPGQSPVNPRFTPHRGEGGRRRIRAFGKGIAIPLPTSLGFGTKNHEAPRQRRCYREVVNLHHSGGAPQT